MAKQKLPDNLNICMVATRFPMLGRATHHGFLWPIARGLALKGHKVTVLSWDNPEKRAEIHQEGVSAYFLSAVSSRKRLSDFPEMAKQKFKELHGSRPFHLLHSIDASGIEIGRRKKYYRLAVNYDVEATRMPSLLPILAMKQDSLTSLLKTASQVAYTFLKGYLGHDRTLLKTADGIFVTTPQQRLTLERYYLYPEKKTYLIPYGLEIGDLSPREKSRELRQKLGVPEDAKVITTTSDMTNVDDLKVLFQAFEHVVIKKPNSRLIVIGNGPLRKEIEFEMLSLALGSKVIFAGAVRTGELTDYIALADVFVNLSSHTAGYEPSLIEAMAQQKLVIGSELSPISYVIEDGMDGFLIRPADTLSLSSLLQHIFNDEIPNSEIGARARTKVINLFDMEKMVSATINAYYSSLLSTGFYRKSK